VTARLPYSAELVVERELSGVRIDSFLVKHFRNYTPWRMQRIVRAGGAAINHAPAAGSDRVFEGQTVSVRLLEPPDKLLAADPESVPVLFDDPWLVVVNKPAGVIAHPTGEYHTGSLANVIQHWLDRRTPLRGLLRPGLVHRLDRQTSGVVVLALHHLAHRRLAEAFEDSRVQKTYLALVEGNVCDDRGSIDLPIGRTPTGRQILMSARGDALAARPARTRYEVVQRFGRLTLVRAYPATGRNHQIRVHLAQIGHPLVGDEFYEAYGKIKPLRPPGEADPDEVDSREVETGLPIRRHALHAERLCLAHPITQVWMEFVAPLPRDFQESITLLQSSHAGRSACRL
jgi:23S rRNA pseudouridine1911/1915/1917 synthase